MQELMDKLQAAEVNISDVEALNKMLSKVVPFNVPHGLVVKEVQKDRIIASIPFQESNWNHVKGMHACAIATIGEFAAGLLLIKHFPFTHYRVIMSTLSLEFFYQGKRDLVGIATLTEQQSQNIAEQLKQGDAAIIEMETQIHDVEQNHVSTATTTWQIKPWDKVHTKM